ncbi:MAG: hypothetical protein UZ22_OP11002000995 [Microgenomates bacterium OLB23]|nr:MAG: hypothetical protein UZ22_OP11002000995 [Microgenomates bacterium OLB23]
MDLTSVNFVAIFLAAVANMVIGALWYSPTMFGTKWSALMGYKAKDLPKMQQAAKNGYAVMFVVSLVMAYVMAHFIQYLGITTVQEACQFGFWVWLGFVGATQISDHIWSEKPLQLLYINSGYRIVATITMALVLTLWV